MDIGAVGGHKYQPVNNENQLSPQIQELQNGDKKRNGTIFSEEEYGGDSILLSCIFAHRPLLALVHTRFLDFWLSASCPLR